MVIKFAINQPALVAGKSLVVPDLHIGYEFELWKSGINVPSQTERLKDKIIKLAKAARAQSIIVLGDIKHEIPRVSKQEQQEIPGFFADLSEHAFLHIVKGNHDGDIDRIISGIKNSRIYPTSGFVLGDFAFAHGNSWPVGEALKAKTLIVGHLHPMFEFYDSFGLRRAEPCWVRAKIDKKQIAKRYNVREKEIALDEIVVCPTFNPLLGGVAVNGKDNIFRGPVMGKILKRKTAEVFLLDGTGLGKIVIT